MTALLQTSVEGSGPLHGGLVVLAVAVAALVCAWYAGVHYRRRVLGGLNASQPPRPSTFPLNSFERAVLTRLAAASSDNALKCQLERAEILSREYTGVGCYSQLAVPPECPKCVATYAEHGPLEGPSFESPAVEHGGGTLLWFSSGRADCLEIYSHGEHFPEDCADLTDFQFAATPNYEACLLLMERAGDADAQEEGYHGLVGSGAKYAEQLLEDLDRHEGLCRAFVIELLGESTLPRVVERLDELMRSAVQSDSENAQGALWFMPDGIGKPFVRRYRAEGGDFSYYLDGIAD